MVGMTSSIFSYRIMGMTNFRPVKLSNEGLFELPSVTITQISSGGTVLSRYDGI